LTEEWFMLLYCLPLLCKVWHKSGSCCWCYIVYHCCLRFDRSGSSCGCYIFYHYCLIFDRGVIHVVFVILSAITILFLAAKLFMSLLYCLPLLCKVWQRSGSCCCCYIVYHYCLRIDRGVVHVTVGYIVYYFCLRFNRGVINVVVVILFTITVLDLTEEWFMSLLYCLPLLFKVWQRSGSCCCCYIVYHYCLGIDRGVVHVTVGYIFYYFCLGFNRGVINVVVVILFTINV
jgi:hypothetical protein